MSENSNDQTVRDALYPHAMNALVASIAFWSSEPCSPQRELAHWTTSSAIESMARVLDLDATSKAGLHKTVRKSLTVERETDPDALIDIVLTAR